MRLQWPRRRFSWNRAGTQEWNVRPGVSRAATLATVAPLPQGPTRSRPAARRCLLAELQRCRWNPRRKVRAPALQACPQLRTSSGAARPDPWRAVRGADPRSVQRARQLHLAQWLTEAQYDRSAYEPSKHRERWLKQRLACGPHGRGGSDYTGCAAAAPSSSGHSRPGLRAQFHSAQDWRLLSNRAHLCMIT